MSESTTVVVVNSKPRLAVMPAGNLQIMPGENDVDRALLQENMDNPNKVVKGWFDENTGFLSIKRGAKKARPIAEDLSQVNWQRAVEIIEKTDNPDVLMRWAKKEQRASVLKAFSKRFKEIETANTEADAQGSGNRGGTE